MAKSFEEELIERNKEAVAPSIFIGLGGQGCDMVAGLAELAKEYDVNSKRLGFIAIDTDVNELRKIKTKASNVVTIQTSSRMTIGEYLRYDDNARENWFPINDIILDKTPSEGAGQVRAISNLVAHNAIREGEFYKIDEAIDAMFPLSTDNYQQSVHVTIISTLAGGTGSGLVLPIALYVRNYLEKVRQQKSSVIRGFFVLPDVMEDVIRHAEERSNIYSNAYASLREIDAFMRRPYDVNIQKRYPNLKLSLPKADGSGYEEFRDRPFDYCFLFNKSNLNETNIKRKGDLLSHAVECIYDMTISPISAKVNSQEDNIIREKIKSNNRQSYAGAGASKLVYPYSDVVNYIALKWIKDSVSSEWLEIDKKVEKERISFKEKGGFGRFDEDASYLEAVEAGKDKTFNKSIIAQCEIKENALEKTDKSADYVAKVDTYAKSILEDSKSKATSNRVKCKMNSASVMQEVVVEDREDYAMREDEMHKKAVDLVDAFKLCVTESLNEAEAKAEFIAAEIVSFKSKDINDYSEEIPVLEKFMSGENDFFMHPNAARYFLIQVSKLLAEKISVYEKAMRSGKENLDRSIEDLEQLKQVTFEHNKKIIKGKYLYSSAEDFEIASTVAEWLGSGGAQGDEDADDNTGNGSLDDLCKHIANVIVFKRLKLFVDNIIDGYKEIFSKLASDLEGIDGKIESLELKYGSQEGKAVKYVCADKLCLERLAMSCPNNIATGDLPGEFTKQFFIKARQYSEKKSSGDLADEFGIYEGCTSEERKRGLDVFFGDIFNDIILANWKGYVEKNYKNKLDMNIVKAIMQEAIYRGCISEQDKFAYLKDIIVGAENLASEFIDKPKGVQPRQLRTAMFNSGVEESIGADAYDEFKDGLGPFQPLPAITAKKNEIRFFSAIYKLSAKNLSKMRPEMKSLATNDESKVEPAGVYFKAYHDRMKNIHPLDSVNTEITPHLQRDWQFINSLPELDEDYQKEYEKRIAKAFVYAIISKKIDYRKQDASGFNYAYELIDAETMSPQLVVSNGTYCDQIYEVLDALSISPAYVERLLKMFYDELSDESNYKINFDESSFVKNAEGFILEEYSKDIKLNIFDIPLIYKESSGADYRIEWGEAIISAIIEMVDEVAEKLSPDKNADTVKLDFLYKLFELLDANLDDLEKLGDITTSGGDNGLLSRGHSRLKNISNDTITLRIYDVVAATLEKNDGKHAYSIEHSEKIDNIVNKRRKRAE